MCHDVVPGFGNKERSGGVPGAYLTILSSAEYYQQSEGRCAEHQRRTHCVWGELSTGLSVALLLSAITNANADAAWAGIRSNLTKAIICAYEMKLILDTSDT